MDKLRHNAASIFFGDVMVLIGTILSDRFYKKRAAKDVMKDLNKYALKSLFIVLLLLLGAIVHAIWRDQFIAH